MPGYFADFIQRGLDKGSKVLFQALGLVVPLLLAKFSQHRDAKEEAWAEHVAKDPTADSRDPVVMTYNVLRNALRRLHRKTLSPFANRSLGFFGHLDASQRKQQLRQGLGHKGWPLLLVKLSDTLRRNINTLISFGKALLACETPRNAHYWAPALAMGSYFF